MNKLMNILKIMALMVTIFAGTAEAGDKAIGNFQVGYFLDTSYYSNTITIYSYNVELGYYIGSTNDGYSVVAIKLGSNLCVTALDSLLFGEAWIFPFNKKKAAGVYIATICDETTLECTALPMNATVQKIKNTTSIYMNKSSSSLEDRQRKLEDIEAEHAAQLEETK